MSVNKPITISVRIDADDIVRRFIDRHPRRLFNSITSVVLSDCYGRNLQLQHILANFYKHSDVFCKYHFFQFQCRTKNLQIVNK